MTKRRVFLILSLGIFIATVTGLVVLALVYSASRRYKSSLSIGNHDFSRLPPATREQRLKEVMDVLYRQDMYSEGTFVWSAEHDSLLTSLGFIFVNGEIEERKIAIRMLPILRPSDRKNALNACADQLESPYTDVQYKALEVLVQIMQTYPRNDELRTVCKKIIEFTRHCRSTLVLAATCEYFRFTAIFFPAETMQSIKLVFSRVKDSHAPGHLFEVMRAIKSTKICDEEITESLISLLDPGKNTEEVMEYTIGVLTAVAPPLTSRQLDLLVRILEYPSLKIVRKIINLLMSREDLTLNSNHDLALSNVRHRYSYDDALVERVKTLQARISR